MEKLALLNKLKIYDKNINIIVCLKEFDSFTLYVKLMFFNI